MVLLSGSAPMVVQDIDGDDVECVWFANGLSHCAEFKSEILVHAHKAAPCQIFP